MASFKLESGGNAKEQAKSAGALLVILGIVCYFLIHVYAGYVLGALGLVLLIGSFAATE